MMQQKATKCGEILLPTWSLFTDPVTIVIQNINHYRFMLSVKVVKSKSCDKIHITYS